MLHFVSLRRVNKIIQYEYNTVFNITQSSAMALQYIHTAMSESVSCLNNYHVELCRSGVVVERENWI